MTKTTNEEAVFEPKVIGDNEVVVTDSQSAEADIKSAMDTINNVDTQADSMASTIETLNKINKSQSDGSTASYYELPKDAKELQDLISFKNMNAQMGEIGRAWYRYGQVAHSEKLRDAKKIKYYIEAEIERLEKYGD